MKFDHQIIHSSAHFEGLRAEWNALLRAGGIPSPFLTWEWMYTWWKTYGEKDPANQLCVVITRADEALLAVLPAYIREQRMMGRKFRELRFLGSEFESSDYLELIHRQGADGTLAADLFTFLAGPQGPGVDLFYLLNILEDRPFAGELQQLAGSAGFEEVTRHHRICPYLPLSGSYEDFLKSLSSNMRYNIRRRSRKLFDHFHATLDMVTSPAEIDEAIDELFRLHEKRFESKNEQSIFQYDLRSGFHKQVARLFLEEDILRFFRLRVEGKTIAMLYCFQFAGELFYFQAGMDPDWEKHSVGMVLMAGAIQYAFEHRLSRFDFMRGAEEYKFKWTDQVRNMVLIELACSRKGKRILGQREMSLQIKESIKNLVPEQGWNFLKKVLQH